MELLAKQIALQPAPNAVQGPRLRHPTKRRKKEEESGRPEKGDPEGQINKSGWKRDIKLGGGGRKCEEN